MLNDLHVLAISDEEENISFSDDETVDRDTGTADCRRVERSLIMQTDHPVLVTANKSRFNGTPCPVLTVNITSPLLRVEDSGAHWCCHGVAGGEAGD